MTQGWAVPPTTFSTCLRVTASPRPQGNIAKVTPPPPQKHKTHATPQDVQT